MTKRFGFTLAEVLITLGIIGVVAAMTMPTLINQTNGAQYKAAYKKALSAISQGVTLNVALDDVSFADTVKGQAGKTDAATEGEGANATEISGTNLASLLSSRMNVVKTSEDGDDKRGYSITGGTLTDGSDGTDTALFFNDSSMFAFSNEKGIGCSEGTKVCYGYIDVNGAKGPNKVVNCDTTTDTAFDTYANGKKTTAAASCTVTSPTDVYPVVYYDQTILPATNAAAAVLYGK